MSINPDISITVVETAGGTESMGRMKNNEMHFGASVTTAAKDAYEGKGPFTGKQMPFVRLIFSYNPTITGFVVRADSGVKALAELDGKLYFPGDVGGSTRTDSEAIFRVLGVKPQYYHGTIPDAIAAFKDRRIVGYSKSGNGLLPDAATLEARVANPIRLLPFSEQEIAKLKAEFPKWQFLKVPANTWHEGQPELRSPGIIPTIIGKNDVPADTVYRIVKAVNERKQDQLAVMPAMKDIDIPKLTVENAILPLHVGAARYYRELGLQIPKEGEPVD